MRKETRCFECREPILPQSWIEVDVSWLEISRDWEQHHKRTVAIHTKCFEAFEARRSEATAHQGGSE